MRQAESLADLMKIRAHHREYFDSINGNLGRFPGRPLD